MVDVESNIFRMESNSDSEMMIGFARIGDLATPCFDSYCAIK